MEHSYERRVKIKRRSSGYCHQRGVLEPAESGGLGQPIAERTANMTDKVKERLS